MKNSQMYLFLMHISNILSVGFANLFILLFSILFFIGYLQSSKLELLILKNELNYKEKITKK